MEEKINIISSQLGDLRVKKNVDLTDYLESKLGGKASGLFIATSTEELIKAVCLCKELKIDFLLMGSGSKINIPKTDILGLVIKNRSHNLKIFGVKGKVSRVGIGIKEAFVEADSGVILSDLASFSRKQGLNGFEDLVLVKGTVGGSILSNQLLRDKITHAVVLNKLGKEIVKKLNEISGPDIILKVVFHLKAKEV